MLYYAIKMLLGERIKYISIVIGLSFASFIITQQAAILMGIVERTFGFITDTSQASIWVVDPAVRFIDDIKPLKDTDLYRVRGVEGVAWATPLYKGLIEARLPSGVNQTCVFVGIDGATFIGQPPRILEGNITALRKEGAVIVDRVGAQGKLASKNAQGELVPLKIGDLMELNDRRVEVVGICEVLRTFQSQPVIYTTYSNATTITPFQRKQLSFVLADVNPGFTAEQVCENIRAVTGLSAYTAKQLKNLTIIYYAKYTGIFVNFGVAILLGFIIGSAIAGQTLYNFTIDNLPYFGVFKAMGAENSVLVKMVLLQALLVSSIGWGIGIGSAALFGLITANTELSFSLPFFLYLLSGFSILIISLFAAFLCIRKVIKLDPAIVFKQ